MVKTTQFNGFSDESLKFLRGLKNNNTKQWFAAHRNSYENHLLIPAIAFVSEMGQKLEQLSPHIISIPKIDKSIFRIYRDIRFSKEKTPYKTHFAMLFWEGNRKKTENPGFYMHFDSEKLFVAAGMHEFPRELLQPYREAVIDPKSGRSLVQAIQEVQKNPENKLVWKYYKKIPRGFDPNHPYSEYLLYRGMGFQWEMPLPAEFYSRELVDFVFLKFKEMSPIHFWLVKLARNVLA